MNGGLLVHGWIILAALVAGVVCGCYLLLVGLSVIAHRLCDVRPHGLSQVGDQRDALGVSGVQAEDTGLDNEDEDARFI